MHFTVFPSAVHYIRVLFVVFLLIVSSCFFLGDRVAFDQLPVPLGGCGYFDTFGDCALSK